MIECEPLIVEGEETKEEEGLDLSKLELVSTFDT